MMGRYLLLCLFTLLVFKTHAEAGAKESGALAFKENKKQWDNRILFETEVHNGTIFLCKTNLTFALLDSGDMNRMRRSHHPHMYNDNLDMTIHGHVFMENFLNTSPDCKIAGDGKLKEYFNYYLGKDPKRWASGVSGFYHVVYQGIYKNIELDVTSIDVNPKYNFVVKPGGNSADIAINYQGLDDIKLVNGDLILKTSIGEITDSKPYAYQMIRGQKHEVKCAFVISGKGNNVAFTFPEGYDKSIELVIDPVLIFSTFSGSTTDNFGYSATYDSKGNAYAAGSAFFLAGTSYPVTPGAFQISWAGGVGFGTPGLDGNGTDVSVTKYDSAGTIRIYSTYLGGDRDELPHSLIVNSHDELFILGTTGSDNFPVTPTAYDTSYNGGVDPGVFGGIGIHYSKGCDMFITRFNSTGTALLGSTYLGGSDNDGLAYPEYSGLNYNYADEVRGEINIDKNDNLYIASCTRSRDFPVTAGAYQNTIGGATDGVVVKMNNSLSAIIWSTFLGGTDDDAIHSIDFDPNGDLYVAGGTISTDFPHTNAVVQDTNRGGRADGFITHLSQNGNAIFQSTYYGSPEYDQVYFIKTDKAGYAYVFGQTEDTLNRFIFNAGYSKPKSGQFISKLSPHLDSVIWSTTFGSGRGTPDISPTAFLVDVCNKTCISGWGSNFFADYNIAGAPPLSTQGLYVPAGAIQTTTDNQDFYVMVMNDDASAISYATYFGSNNDEEHVDGGTSRFDKKGVIYQSVCAGCNGKSTFPTTPGVVSRTNNSPNCNNAVFKIDLLPPIVVADFSVPNTICTPDTLAFLNFSKTVTSPSFLWTFGDGTTSTDVSPTHTYVHSGIYTVQLVVNDPGSCNFTDTLSKQIVVISPSGIDTIPSVTICSGQATQIGLPASSDTAVTYTWSPATGLTQTNVSNPFASPPQTTNYHLVISNGFCSDTFYQTIYFFNDTLTMQGGNLSCPYDSLQISVADSKPNQQLTYRWTPAGTIDTGANSATPLVKPLVSTTFTVTVVNQLGCVYSDSVRVNVLSTGSLLNITATPDTINFGDTSQLLLRLVQNVSSYQWVEDTTLSATNILNPYAHPLQTHAYFVLAQDSLGCITHDTIVVHVLLPPCKESSVFVPDAFTPNGDGKNDVLYVRSNGTRDLYFVVFDRWGQKMFETTDITRGWDGTYKSKRMDAAVFGYYVKGHCADGNLFEKKGNVTLLR